MACDVNVWSIDSTAFRGLTAKLSGHQANLVQVASGNDQRGRAFFTLDEAFQVIVWDVATLPSLQTFNLLNRVPDICWDSLTWEDSVLQAAAFMFTRARI